MTFGYVRYFDVNWRLTHGSFYPSKLYFVQDDVYAVHKKTPDSQPVCYQRESETSQKYVQTLEFDGAFLEQKMKENVLYG